jgi:hypothetical protein
LHLEIAQERHATAIKYHISIFSFKSFKRRQERRRKGVRIANL